MTNRLLALLTKLATGRLIIVSFLLIVVINKFVLPAIYPPDTLDVQFSYSPEKAYQLIGSYGEEGRQYYALIELTLDLFYPILSALFFSSLTIYTFRRIFPLNSFWQKLPLLGPIVMVVDYLENTGILVMLFSYPRQLDIIAQATNIFTVTKSALSVIELILMVIGLVGLLGKIVYTMIRRDAGEESHEK